MEDIIAQQKITNARLIRIENKNLELRNVLVNILESSLGIKNVMDSMKSGFESVRENNDNVITEIKNLSEITTNSLSKNSDVTSDAIGEVAREDAVNTSEEERESIVRENKVIELLTDIKEILSIKPKEKEETIPPITETSLLDLIPGIPPLPIPGRPAPPGRPTPVPPLPVPVPPGRPTPVPPGAPVPVPLPPGAPVPPGRPTPVPPGAPVPDAPLPPTVPAPEPDVPDRPRRPGLLRRIRGKLGGLARGALRVASTPYLAVPAAIAGAMEGIEDYEKTGEWDKGMFGFAGGATEFLSAGIVSSESVKTGLADAQLGLSDKMTELSEGLNDTVGGISNGISSIREDLNKSFDMFNKLDWSDKLTFMLTGSVEKDEKKDELTEEKIKLADSIKRDVSASQNLVSPASNAQANAGVLASLAKASQPTTPAGALEKSTAEAGVTATTNVINNNVNTVNNAGSTNVNVASGAPAGNNSKPTFSQK